MNDIPKCAHTHDDGQPCQAIPVKNTSYCYFHRKYYNPPALPGDKNYQAPLLESHHSIELALTQLYQAFLAKKIDMKEARFGLQIRRLASKTISAIEKAKKEEQKDEKAAEFGSAERVWKPAPTLGSPVETCGADYKSVSQDVFLKHTIVNHRLDRDERMFQDATAQAEAAQPKRGVWDPYGCMPGGNGNK